MDLIPHVIDNHAYMHDDCNTIIIGLDVYSSNEHAFASDYQIYHAFYQGEMGMAARVDLFICSQCESVSRDTRTCKSCGTHDWANYGRTKSIQNGFIEFKEYSRYSYKLMTMHNEQIFVYTVTTLFFDALYYMRSTIKSSTRCAVCRRTSANPCNECIKMIAGMYAKRHRIVFALCDYIPTSAVMAIARYICLLK